MRPAYREGYRLLPPADTGGRPAPPKWDWVPFDAAVYRVGHAGDGFAFDSEGPRHRVFLEPFAIASRLVTCGEFLAFMADGGYDRPELWLSDGWAARRLHNWKAPLYWERHIGHWHVFTLDGLRPLDEAEPVCHISFYEADAYARWSGARLPTEAEWEVASAGRPVAGNLLEDDRLHPVPFASVDQVVQLFGDVWEWTQSPYSPYPGYRPLSGALGECNGKMVLNTSPSHDAFLAKALSEYNGKFMVNQKVLRGGSCVTARSHIRPTYRNFFPPEAKWQFSGIRLAMDARI